MQKFDSNSGSFGEKVNFVDENNVFVGYCLDQNCCENADWFVSEKITPYSYDGHNDIKDFDFSGYSFDKLFMQSVESDSLDSGGQVCFKMVNKNGDVKYLNLFNSHNGYYHHGFEFKNGDDIIKSGSL